MKFRIANQDEDSAVVLYSEPGAYDAVPVLQEVVIDAVPWRQHPDRMAVALCLIYGASTAGVFELPMPGCSEQVASAIEDFLSPTACTVFPVNLIPSRIVRGNVVLDLFWGESEGISLGSRTVVSRDGRTTMRILDQSVGSFASEREFTVATNALLINARGEPNQLSTALPALGIAVLFGEDLFIDQICVPNVDPNTPDEMKRKVGRLLDAVGLRLSWVGMD